MDFTGTIMIKVASPPPAVRRVNFVRGFQELASVPQAPRRVTCWALGCGRRLAEGLGRRRLPKFGGRLLSSVSTVLTNTYPTVPDHTGMRMAFDLSRTAGDGAHGS